MDSQDLIFKLHNVTSVLVREVDQILMEQLGIGFSQYKVLYTLQQNPKLHQKGIADMIGQTEASVSRQIRVLTKLGYLESSVSLESRRAHDVQLTVMGIKVISRAAAIVARYQRGLKEKLSDKELKHGESMISSLQDAALA